MKCLSPSSSRLLPYLLFQASAVFLRTSGLKAAFTTTTNKASCATFSGFNTINRLQRDQVASFYCCLRKDISESCSTRRKMTGRIHSEDNMTSDSIISTTGIMSASSPYTGASPTICPKCNGEGRLSKAPSKKARLRQQRRIYQEQQKQQCEQENTQTNNHKRFKPSPPSSTATPVDVKNGKKVHSQEPELPRLPRRWDPCPKCDQTGLLMHQTIKSSERTASAFMPTHDRPPVAIVGGGIGGIALAVALRHRGIPFVVYEKDSRFNQRRQGYGLTLQQARRALQALGIFENDPDERNSSSGSGSGMLLQEHAVTSTKHVVHTPDGKQVGEWGLRRWVGDPNSCKNGRKNSGDNGSGSCKKDRINGASRCDKEIENTTDTKDSNDKSNEALSSKTKIRSTRAKNRKRRQNLHVPRQTLRYALLEALKEANGIGGEKSAVVSKISAANVDDMEDTKGINSKDSSDQYHSKLDISWGHKLVDIRPMEGDTGTNNVQLSFEVVDENGNDKGIVNAQASLVVGCDGIRSSVREKFLRTSTLSNDKFNESEDIEQTDSLSTPLRYLNCVVILGICPLGDLFPQGPDNEREQLAQQQKEKQMELSPLLDGESVFQTADGTTRIYLMPYSKKNNEYMWQLSFPMPEEEAAIALSRRGSRALKEEALRRCQCWHVPIPEILKATPIDLVSGYPVYDRDILTSESLSASRKDLSTTNDSADTYHSLPITLLGDAAHPMSPFKGQGANQALLDALSLARALYRIHYREGRSLEEALEYYENEMLGRSTEKVRASSAAAQFLHTDIAIQEGDVTRGAAFNSSSSIMNAEFDHSKNS